jgi:hypothetical protein
LAVDYFFLTNLYQLQFPALKWKRWAKYDICPLFIYKCIFKYIETGFTNYKKMYCPWSESHAKYNYKLFFGSFNINAIMYNVYKMSFLLTQHLVLKSNYTMLRENNVSKIISTSGNFAMRSGCHCILGESINRLQTRTPETPAVLWTLKYLVATSIGVVSRNTKVVSDPWWRTHTKDLNIGKIPVGQWFPNNIISKIRIIPNKPLLHYYSCRVVL